MFSRFYKHTSEIGLNVMKAFRNKCRVMQVSRTRIKKPGESLQIVHFKWKE